MYNPHYAHSLNCTNHIHVHDILEDGSVHTRGHVLHKVGDDCLSVRCPYSNDVMLLFIRMCFLRGAPPSHRRQECLWMSHVTFPASLMISQASTWNPPKCQTSLPSTMPRSSNQILPTASGACKGLARGLRCDRPNPRTLAMDYQQSIVLWRRTRVSRRQTLPASLAHVQHIQSLRFVRHCLDAIE